MFSILKRMGEMVGLNSGRKYSANQKRMAINGQMRNRGRKYAAAHSVLNATARATVQPKKNNGDFRALLRKTIPQRVDMFLRTTTYKELMDDLRANRFDATNTGMRLSYEYALDDMDKLNQAKQYLLMHSQNQIRRKTLDTYLSSASYTQLIKNLSPEQRDRFQNTVTGKELFKLGLDTADQLELARKKLEALYEKFELRGKTRNRNTPTNRTSAANQLQTISQFYNAARGATARQNRNAAAPRANARPNNPSRPRNNAVRYAQRHLTPARPSTNKQRRRLSQFGSGENMRRARNARLYLGYLPLIHKFLSSQHYNRLITNLNKQGPFQNTNSGKSLRRYTYYLPNNNANRGREFTTEDFEAIKQYLQILKKENKLRNKTTFDRTPNTRANRSTNRANAAKQPNNARKRDFAKANEDVRLGIMADFENKLRRGYNRTRIQANAANRSRFGDTNSWRELSEVIIGLDKYDPATVAPFIQSHMNELQRTR